MAESIILCVDDDTTVLHALRSLLSKHLGSDHLVEIAESGNEALEIDSELRTSGRELSLVISDYIMPGMRGDELLVKLHAQSPNTVKIMLTGQSDLEGVKRAINGANLYRFLEKPFNNADIVLTARSAVRSYQQERALEAQNAQLRTMNEQLEQLVEARTRELVAKNAELERLAVTDRLTGLYNRLKLDQFLAQEHTRCERYGGHYSAVLLDIDHFKAVNDRHGHLAGDAVLVALAQLLKAGTRETDLAGRWGGEEFLVIAPSTVLDGALDIANKLRESVAAFTFPEVKRCTASFGVATHAAGDSIAAVIGRADAALYQAKAGGRNCVRAQP